MQPKLQSQLKINSFGLELDHASSLLLMGSCFAENIGKRLIDLKFDCTINPLGISYNPVSLFHLLERSLKRDNFKEAELSFLNERHFSFDLHSEFSKPNAAEFIAKANEQLKAQVELLKEADCLVLSLGTAWVHILKKEGRLVNNCHKIPASEFEKARLSVKEIVGAFNSLAKKLNKLNSKLKVIFTISPIRHLKDGFRENQLSKSSLHLAVDEICQMHSNCYYFPSYEIMMDELRDYRFYERDLIHPNNLAIDIIWEQFQKACLSQASRKVNADLEKFRDSMDHRPFNYQSKANLNFLKGLLKDLQKFEKQHNIALGREVSEIKSRISQHSTT